MLRRMVYVLLAVALLIPVGVAGVWIYNQGATPALAQTPVPPATYVANQTITVIGQSTVKVQPDIAQVSIGVETVGTTVSQAVTDNETQMTAILAALKAQGIADKDIQTMNYSISIDRSPQPLAQSGGTSGTEQSAPQYHVSNTVNVTVRDLAKVSDVLDAVIKAGANNIWGVSFSVADPKPAQDQARAAAMADAQSRAQALAQLGKVTLGPIMSISETLGSPAPVMYAVAERAMGAGGPSISPGEVEISYQVQVSFYIQP